MRHNITRTAVNEHGGTYKVSLRIPLNKGWIDNVKLYVWRYGQHRNFAMQFIKEDENYAYFEVDGVELQNCPLYYYYFSFCANGKFQYYKKENFSEDVNIKTEECFKLSVNFNVPEWAKGCIVYQIFPDRFCKGKGSVKNPMPRRHLHENWEEQQI